MPTMVGSGEARRLDAQAEAQMLHAPEQAPASKPGRRWRGASRSPAIAPPSAATTPETTTDQPGSAASQRGSSRKWQQPTVAARMRQPTTRRTIGPVDASLEAAFAGAGMGPSPE